MSLTTIYDRPISPHTVRLGVTLVAAAVGIACSRTGEPAPPERLLVLSADGSVTTMDRTGGDRTTLREGNGDAVVVLQPTWGPDGRSAVWTELDTATLKARIVVWNGEVGSPVEAPVSPFYYSWSPDGTLVAFLGSAGSGSGIRLGMLDVAAGTATEIDAGRPYYLDWDPRGGRLVVHVGGEDLLLLDVDGRSTDTGLTTGLFQAPDWSSADGVVVVGRGEGGGVSAALPGRLVGLRQQAGDRLLLVDPDQGVSRELASVSGVVAFGVDPRGSRLAYTNGDASFIGPLSVIDIGGGEAVVVSKEPVAAFQWAPGGTRLWFLTIDVEARLLVPHVWEADRTLDFPGFLPTQVFARDYLQFWDQYTRSLTLWAPDSSAFAYAASADGAEDGIFVQPVAPNTGPSGVSDGVFASFAPVPADR